LQEDLPRKGAGSTPVLEFVSEASDMKGGKETFAATAKAPSHNGKIGLLRRQISTFARSPPLDATKCHSTLYRITRLAYENFFHMEYFSYIVPLGSGEKDGKPTVK
jgi:hypothetical protein